MGPSLSLRERWKWGAAAKDLSRREREGPATRSVVGG
jgi:hypothetical protein